MLCTACWLHSTFRESLSHQSIRVLRGGVQGLARPGVAPITISAWTSFKTSIGAGFIGLVVGQEDKELQSFQNRLSAWVSPSDPWDPPCPRLAFIIRPIYLRIILDLAPIIWWIHLPSSAWGELGKKGSVLSSSRASFLAPEDLEERDFTNAGKLHLWPDVPHPPLTSDSQTWPVDHACILASYSTFSIACLALERLRPYARPL